MTERERRFVECYMGEAAGNGTKAALLAGYSPVTARNQASRLLTKGYIQSAIEERSQRDVLTWSREQRQVLLDADRRRRDGADPLPAQSQ